ncbi:glycosyltransferase family 4 protein [Bacteroides ihuae]|uniref:glycosyltransferase family 4 protein n=1 Tax=Bacteroides ihuae TaxID=1852362 RepID=UPI0008DAA88E|nr:glycosyltransferase family 4 protein [Bacteroides ihuae]
MENKNKILWIVTELFPPDETSTSYILGEIANKYVEKYVVKVICGPEIYDKHKKLDENNNFRLDPSIEVFRANGEDLDKNTTKGKTLSFVLMSSRMIKLVKQHIKKDDKVLMVTNPAPLVVLMSRLKKKVGFELNILVHDVFPENTKPAGLKLPMYGLFKHVFDKAYSGADQLIALGRDMKDVLEQKVKKYNPNLKISIVENWADIDGIKPQPFSEDKIILQYAGNIGRVQGLDKVINNLPENVEFHLYGTGFMEKTLKAMNHPRVIFHGPYFRSQQNDVLAACDVAVVTLQEGMYGLGVPSKTYNILASGRPVMYLGPVNSEIDLLVREEGIGFCGWPETWNKEDLATMGKKAREVAVRDYSEETILNKFLKEI